MDQEQRTVDQDPVLATQMMIIDRAVRSARDHEWCGEFERVMRQVFPDGPPDGGREFVDSDGWSCRGMDRDGYDRDGRNRDGYDRDGYDYRDRDRDGYDRDGYSYDGYNRDGWNRDGYDRHGFTRDGIHARTGLHRDSDEYRARFRYDAWGYDRDGYNRHGVDREGNRRDGGISPYRYDEHGSAH